MFPNLRLAGVMTMSAGCHWGRRVDFQNFDLNLLRVFDEVMAERNISRAKIYSKDLLELLFFEFYTKNEYIRTKLNISRQTATSYLKQLEEVGILSSEKIGKEIIYKNISLFKIAKN